MEIENKPDKKKEKKEWWLEWYVFVSALLVITVVWIFSYFAIMNVSSDCQEAAGQTGDTFGAVNALFSGFAFTGIIFTILIQSKELRMQREELELTTAEFAKQNATLKIQTFENTFFNLLAEVRKMAEKMTARNSGKAEVGVHTFDYINIAIDNGVKAGSSDEENRQAYDAATKHSQIALTQYLTCLFGVLNYTNETKLDRNKVLYYTIVGSTMAYGELCYLSKYILFTSNEENKDLVNKVLSCYEGFQWNQL